MNERTNERTNGRSTDERTQSALVPPPAPVPLSPVGLIAHIRTVADSMIRTDFRYYPSQKGEFLGHLTKWITHNATTRCKQ